MVQSLIVGDCGGTNTRLALIEIEENEIGQKHKRGERAPGKSMFDKKYLNEEHKDFETVLRLFIAESTKLLDINCPRVACLACAGPILDNTVDFTNIENGWFIDGKKLKESLHIDSVILVNDFTAMGYGLLTLKPEELNQLNDAKIVEDGVIATIGAGTGLGECFLTKGPGDEKYYCWASEGGHTDFSPRGQFEYDLLLWLREKHNEEYRVSVERVISGPGLASIYDYMCERNPDMVNEKLHAEINAAGSLKGGKVAMNADKYPLCKRTMEIFFTSYAAECGNAMLKYLPYGGFYITGGIAVKNLEYIINSKSFLDTMFGKGRVSPAIRKCPVFVVMVDDVGERGAHLVAYNALLKL